MKIIYKNGEEDVFECRYNIDYDRRHAIKVYYEDVREGLLKVQKWMEEMGYDEDIEDDEEEME